MTFDTVSEAKLRDVYPGLRAQARLIPDLYNQTYPGDPLRVMQGMRTWNQQRALWLQGRDAAGNVVDPKLIVTHAPPGHSWHEAGLALDLAPASLLVIPGWMPSSPKWLRIGEIAESLGLTWGGRWPEPKTDRPHVQMTGSLPVSPDDATRQAFIAGGVDAVWKLAGLTVNVNDVKAV